MIATLARPPVEPILTAYAEGRAALLLVGRSLQDLTVDADGKLRTLLEVLRRELRSRHGMALLTYSLAEGLEWDEARLPDERDRRTIRSILQGNHLHDIPLDAQEPARVIRGVAALARTPTDGWQWADGQPMRFAFLFSFVEHLAPGSLTNGTQTDPQLLAIELAHLVAQSLAVRASGNLVLFHGREGLIDELVGGALYRVRLPMPDGEEKRGLLGAARPIYPQAQFEEGLTDEIVTYLTTNTPNRGLEALLRAGHRTAGPITAAQLAGQRNRDVEEASEQTLTVLDTNRVDGIELYGTNVDTARRVLEFYAEHLAQRDPHIPANILLAGAPGTGKTDLALRTARKAKVAAYQLVSPKSGIVGETERRARLQQQSLREWVPNIGWIDEITEAMPMERSEFDGDSGASRAVMAAMLNALSDESRCGESLILAATNVPWRISAAMLTRFEVLAVLRPLERDFPGMIVTIVRSIADTTTLTQDDPAVQEAASLFYQKGASPREIRKALAHVGLMRGSLDAQAVVIAAHDLSTAADLASSIYSELWAVKCCSYKAFLPWHANPRDYPYPAHLQGIVDPETGEIRRTELDRRIEEYRPHANV
jgi:AAA+ superfamily predicted ATPase